MSNFFSSIFKWFYLHIHNNPWGHNYILNITRLLHLYYVSVIWDICVYMGSMWKIVREERITPNFCNISARRDIARNYGAYDRTRPASDSILKKRRISFKTLLTTNFTIYYFTNFNVFKFNSTFTRLPNTNVYPSTLVLPT